MTRNSDADDAQDANDEASTTEDVDEETPTTDDSFPAEGAGDRDPVSLRTDRRDYLRALGGIGAAGMVGSMAVPSATAQSGFDEAAADQRIRDNQTGPVTVEVVDENGDPVSNAQVEVEMTEHDFHWGNMVNVDNLLNRFGEGSQYYEHLRELFNTAVLENAHKWAIWEGNQQAADDAVDWLDAEGFRIRGHTALYGVEYAIPGNVQTAADNGDGQTVRDETMQQIEDIITHYGDTIQEWDLVNEVVHRGHLQEGVYPGEINADDPMSSQRSPWTTPLLADWYSHAESVVDDNGLDVEIGTNDFNTLTWDQDPYYEQVQFLADQGVGVDFMGHQAHIGPTNVNGQQWDYGIVNGLFEQYADLPATQRITEYDMAGDSWSGHQQRADVMRVFLKTAYGHPDVDEFTIWGMWDETHWQGEAPFFEEDWSEKPALDVFRSLVHDEWWTDETATTGSDGTATVDAFLGEHEVRVDGTVVGTVSVTDPGGTTVQVTGDEVTGTPGGEDPQPADPPSVSAVQLNGTYRVENLNSGLALSTEGGSTEDGANVVQRSYDGSADQHWTFEHLGDGVHRIENAASGAALDVLDGGVGDGVNVRQWPWNGAGAQRFLVGEADDGDLVIVNQNSNRVLDVSGGSTEDGANVQQYTYYGNDNQEWSVTAVDGDGLPTVGENANAPTDPDADGLYEDVNGDGATNLADAGDLFQHRNDAAVQDNVDAYDFSGNDEIDLADVVDLFQENTE